MIDVKFRINENHTVSIVALAVSFDHDKGIVEATRVDGVIFQVRTEWLISIMPTDRSKYNVDNSTGGPSRRRKKYLPEQLESFIFDSVS